MAFEEYLIELEKAGYLAQRYCGFKKHSLKQCIKYISETIHTEYVIYNQLGQVIAEFALENPTGKAWQIHFSLAPKLKLKEKITIAKQTVKCILSWPEVSALYGITPCENKQACWFVLKVGFKKLAILPEGIIYKGYPQDAMLTLYGGK